MPERPVRCSVLAIFRVTPSNLAVSMARRAPSTFMLASLIAVSLARCPHVDDDGPQLATPCAGAGLDENRGVIRLDDRRTGDLAPRLEHVEADDRRIHPAMPAH